MKNKGQIYVVTHKKTNLSTQLKNKGYSLISVGEANNLNLDSIKDNQGDNISSKNANYCELTALYWIWKNDEISKYKGLCHYRRFLTTSCLNIDENKYVSIDDVRKFIEDDKYDIVLPRIQYFTRTASENYLRCGYKKDIEKTRDIIGLKYSEYVEYFDEVFNGNKSYLTNMMVASSEIFNDYCEWLFDILFEVEAQSDLTGYSVQEARIYGYLSERLLTVWILKNKLKVKEVNYINIDEKKGVSYSVKQIMISLGLYQFIKTCVWRIKCLLKK